MKNELGIWVTGDSSEVRWQVRYDFNQSLLNAALIISRTIEKWHFCWSKMVNYRHGSP